VISGRRLYSWRLLVHPIEASICQQSFQDRQLEKNKSGRTTDYATSSKTLSILLQYLLLGVKEQQVKRHGMQ